MNEEKINGMKSLIRAVLQSSKDGVATSRFLSDYKEFAGEYLPYKEMGYPSVVEMIKSIPDVARIRPDYTTGEERVYAVADETTAHIQKMVSRQRSTKKKRKLPKAMYRRPSRPMGNMPARPLHRFRGSTGIPPHHRRAPLHPAYSKPFSSRPSPLLPTPSRFNNGDSNSYFQSFKVTVGHGDREVNSHYSQRPVVRSDRERKPRMENDNRVREIPPRFQKKEEGFSSDLKKKPPDSFSNARPTYIIKQNVIEVLKTVTVSMWSTRLPVVYNEMFGEPPENLLDMVKSCSDICTVEQVPYTNREIIYPKKEEEISSSNSVSEVPSTTVNHFSPSTNNTSTTITSTTNNHHMPSSTSTNHTQSFTSTTKASSDVSLSKSTPASNLFKDTVIPPPPVLTIGSDVIVYVTYATSVTEFCVQLESSCCDQINEVLQSVCKTLPTPNVSFIQKDIYCSALYSEDGFWYRAKVISDVKNDELCVCFVDYGNIETVKLECIRQLPAELCDIPGQSIICSLSGIKPPQNESQWSKASLMIFADFVRDQALIASTRAYQDDVYDIDIYRQGDKDQSLSQVLIDKKEAVPLSFIARRTPNDPELLELPDEKFLFVYVSYLNPETGVTVRLVGEQFSDKLEQFEFDLENFYKVAQFDHVISVGMICVISVDSLYHRVRVMSIEDNKAECYYLDHGDTDMILLEVLKPIDVSLNKTLPYQALCLELYGLEDYTTNTTVLDKLLDLALGKICVAEIMSREESVVVVLYDTEDQEDVNINEYIVKVLISEGHALDLNLFSGNTKPPSLCSDNASVCSNDSNSNLVRNDSNPNLVRTNSISNLVQTEDSSESAATALGIQTGLQLQAVDKLQTNFENLNLAKSVLEDNPSVKSSTSSLYTWENPGSEKNSTPTKDLALAISEETLSSTPVKDFAQVMAVASNLSINSASETTMPAFAEIPAVGQMFSIYVLWVVDPSNFVCIPYSQVNVLEKFMIDLNHYFNKTAVLEEIEGEVGELYAGLYNDNWYRMIVKECIGTELSVYMADYGEYTILSADKLQLLPKQYRQLPFTAFKARLHGVDFEGENWSETSKYVFIQMAQGRSFIAMVGSKEEDKMVSLKLIDTSNEQEDVCIDEVLVTMSLARKQ